MSGRWSSAVKGRNIWVFAGSLGIWWDGLRHPDTFKYAESWAILSRKGKYENLELFEKKF